MRLAFLLFVLAILMLVAGAARSDSQPDGSITLTPAEQEQMKADMEAIVRERERAAFQAGVQYQKQACPSLI